MNIDLKETHETSASQFTLISTLNFWTKSGYFYSILSKLDKAEYAALIHAHMCAYNYFFDYKSVERVFLLFNPNIVYYSPFCEFTFHFQCNLVRYLLHCNTLLAFSLV